MRAGGSGGAGQARACRAFNVAAFAAHNRRWREALERRPGYRDQLVLRPAGGTEFAAWSIDVLVVRDGRIASITSFVNADFAAFGLPPVAD